MKKNLAGIFYVPQKELKVRKLFRIMKLSVLFLFICILQLYAGNTYSQPAVVHIEENSLTLQKLITEIENQTDYLFVYSRDDIDAEHTVKVQTGENTVAGVLEKALSDTDMTYVFANNYISLRKRSEKSTVDRTGFSEMLPVPDRTVKKMKPLSSFPVPAQTRRIAGTIVDPQGAPVIGANIIEKGTTNGVVTDIDGKFSINVNNNATLQISYIGFLTQEIAVAGRTSFTIVLSEDLKAIDEVVVVGYGVKRKETLTGSVASVSGEEIITTKNENVQNMLTGKLPGVRVYEKTAEPGAFAGNFDIRGFGTPMVVIDGVISDLTAFQRLDPNDIENLSVLKDGSASIYGVRAANGVILVTTNRGSEGKTTLNYSGRMGWKIPTGSPKSTTAAEWMTLRNERVMRNVNANNTPPYSQELIQEYLDGTQTSYDWWDAVMQPSVPETQHNLSISGGNSKVTYYMSGGYSYGESFLRSNDYNYERFNLRSNISANITSRLKASLNMYGMMDKRNQGINSADWVIRSMQRAPAIMPIYVNDDPNYLYFGLIEGENPVAMSTGDISGYRKDEIKEFNGSASAAYQVPYIDGLTANVMFSYRYRLNEATRYERKYEMFRPDEATGAIVSRGYRQSPSKIRRETYSRPQMLYNLSLDYKRKFNDAHNVEVLALWEGSRRQSDNFNAERELSMNIPYLLAGNSANQTGSMSGSESNFYNKTYQALVGRLGYDFKSKYLLEFAFRYDGSSVWDKNGRWGFFPSAFAGWRVSEEAFWKNSSLNVVNNLKLRASYGEMGDDSPAENYTWLQGWNYPASGGSDALETAYNRLPNGYYLDGTFVTSVNSRGLINPDITWIIAKVTNLGLDVDVWNGLLGASFDYFKRDRTGRLATRDVAVSSTLGASLPQENLNSDRNFGYELELRHHNKIDDFKYSVSGMVAYTRRMVLHREIAQAGNSWENYTRYDNDNRYQGIHVGRAADGRFQSYEDVANSLVYYGRSTLPGDYIYEDWNGDGRINDLDNHPIAYEQNATPPLYFSLNINGEWKGFDLSMLWQGAALSYVRYVEQLQEPMWGNDNSNALEFFLDRWRPTEVGINPFEHTTQWIPGKFAATGAWPNTDSEHNLYNTSYLRLKTIELGYTIPFRLLNKIGIQMARFYVNAYNLLTIKDKDLISDPEHTSDTWGNAYPMAKSFSVGLNFKF
jgi:TonB-linked SusC/RagA family outer membrane protein